MAQYIYGKLISTGKIIKISEVPKDINMRKAWACVCPHCGASLMARRGDRREDHFAHKPQDISGGGSNGAGCSAGIANETALHLMAKEILLDELEAGTAQLVVPPVEFAFREANIKDIPHEVLRDIPHSIEYRKSKALSYTKASVETWYSGFRPDVIIETAEGEYLIEICVTHAVQAEKKEMAEKQGIPILEIDLSAFTEDPISKKDLRDLIIQGIARKHWVVRPNKAKVLDWGCRRYANIVRFHIEKYRAEQVAKEEARKRRANRFKPQNYTADLKWLESQSISSVQECYFYRYWKKIPFFLNIPIYGEIIFRCNRQVWQGAIFDHFVFNRRPENDGVYVEKIISWIKHHQKVFSVDWDLLKESLLLKDVITTYLDYLDGLGFLSDSYAHYKIERAHSICPPNREYSEKLQSVLSSVDRYSVEIDALLYQETKLLRDKIDKERREEARRNAELEEKRRAEEARQNAELQEKLRAEKQMLKVREDKERTSQMIQSGEFGPEMRDSLWDSQGNRLAFCTVCNTITRAYGMQFEPGNLHKGICAKCRQAEYQRIKESFDPNASEWTVDKCERRWIQCKVCGEIKRDFDFSSYGGINGMNLGLCKVCSRKGFDN